MAKHLTSAQLQSVLATVAGDLTPEDLDDLLDAMSRVNSRQGPEHARSTELTLANLFPSSMQP